MQYADAVARLLEQRGTGARVTSEVTDSALAVGGALAATQKTLGIAADTVAQVAVGVIVLRELQGIFNARGRSEAFTDAAYLIRQAQSEFRQYNPMASPDHMTENGAILISRVDAALHAARKTLNGRMPALRDLQQATQPMTKTGATQRSNGTPQTMFTASGEMPGRTAPTTEQVEQAVDRKVAGMEKRLTQNMGALKPRLPNKTEYTARVGKLQRELKTIIGKDMEELWTARRAPVTYPGESPARNIFFDELKELKKVPEESAGKMPEATVELVKAWETDLGL
jgi:hypothetical protein